MLTLHPKYIYISIYQYFIISENIEKLKNLQMLTGSHSLKPANVGTCVVDYSLGLQD